jgi:Flp pilus assembly protein TadD
MQSLAIICERMGNFQEAEFMFRQSLGMSYAADLTTHT